MINHSSVVNLLFAMQNRYPFTSSDTYLLKTFYTFDVSVTELFGWYMGGGKLAILEKNGEKDPQIIFDWIYRHHVTQCNAKVPLLELLKFPTIRRLCENIDAFNKVKLEMVETMKKVSLTSRT
jgi:non-ribosomal peptide synthetase component F